MNDKLQQKINGISVIVTAHHEGRMAHHTMNSLFRAIRHAKEGGIRTELIVVLDRPDEKTTAYFKRYNNDIKHIRRVDFGDPGLARNYGVTLSSSRYVAFLDADDLSGKSWLRAAYEEAEKRAEHSVYHPEYVIGFGRDHSFIRNKNMDDTGFFVGNLIEFNCWNSVHFLTHRELLVELPFAPTPPESGFGYEDWHWNCEVVARGIQMRIVPNTCVFYRKKQQDSRLSSHNQDSVLIRPSRLFDPAVFSALLEKEQILKTERAPQ